jgi:hypothetical protein
MQYLPITLQGLGLGTACSFTTGRHLEYRQYGTDDCFDLKLQKDLLLEVTGKWNSLGLCPVKVLLLLHGCKLLKFLIRYM